MGGVLRRIPILRARVRGFRPVQLRGGRKAAPVIVADLQPTG